MVHINKKYGKAAGESMSAALKTAGASRGIHFTDDRKVCRNALSCTQRTATITSRLFTNTCAMLLHSTCSMLCFSTNCQVHNTLLSHRLVHLAEQQGKQDAVIEAIFKGYFEHGINLSDINTLVDIAEAAGVQDSRAYLESDQDADTVLREYMDDTFFWKKLSCLTLLLGFSSIAYSIACVVSCCHLCNRRRGLGQVAICSD